MVTDVCVPGDSGTDLCVSDLNTCLATLSYNTPEGGLQGLLGLGKNTGDTPDQQANNFVQQLYLAENYEPWVTFEYHF